MKMTERSSKGEKTLWENEKLLLTSHFSFSYSVFKRLLQKTHKGDTNQGLLGKGLMTIKNKAVENSVEKGENAGYQHFLLFP